MEMPTIIEVATGSTRGAGPAPAENSRAADARRAARPHAVDVTVHGAVTDRGYGRDGADKHVHVHRGGGGPAERVFTDRQRQMLANLDKHGDVNGEGSGGARAGVSTTGVTVVERVAGAPAEPEKQAQDGGEPAKEPDPAAAPTATGGEQAKPDDAKPVETPAEKPAAPAAPDPKLAAELERLQAHNRRLVAELEHRSTPQLDDRLRALDEIERGFLENPIASLERMAVIATGAKDADAPEVKRFLAGVYGDWTERELKVPMDRAARAEFGTERNRLLMARDRREREAAAKAGEGRSQAERRQQVVRDTVAQLDRQLAANKHADKFPLLMQAEDLDGITPGQKLYSAIAHGIAAGDWPELPTDDVLVEHYSKQIEKEYAPRDQKLRARYAPKPTPTAATPAQANDSSTEKAADAPAKAEQAGVRTITNASASVAPPAPPKEAAPAATPTAKDDKEPKFRNEAERRVYLARKHFGDA